MKRGYLVVLSAPSGTGKSTIIKELLRQGMGLIYSISTTTRQPREGEVEGKHYYFVDRKKFRRKISEGEFLEWAKVHDEYYGTSKKKVENLLKKGFSVVLDLDVQGATSVKRKYPDAVLIFISPPSWTSLKERLVKRKKDSRDTIEKRLKNARDELLWAKQYDYIVLNDRVSNAVKMIESIIDAENHRVTRINHSFGLIPKVKY